jgi:paraquat-inducible protein A
LIAAAILYIPANVLPVMSVYMLGAGQPDTIISGVYHLLEAGQWPLAVIVFVASIVVPLLKLFTLSFLLISIQRKSKWRQHDRMRLYRVTEYVGRWSMVDVFVIAILTGLVQFGNLARVDANVGSFSFAAVVVLTMFAARTLDGHLIWDISRQEEQET